MKLISSHYQHITTYEVNINHQNSTYFLKFITKDTFPNQQYWRKKKCSIKNDSTQLRKVMRSAYFRRNNQQLPGPTRSAK